MNVDEALRYLGAGGVSGGALRNEMQQLADRLAERFRPVWTYRVFPVERSEGVFRLPGSGLELSGQTAERMLGSCSRAVLLACTLGLEFESFLRMEQARDISRAAMADACGSAMVEAGCNAAEAGIKARFPGLYLTDRFSPGYGDLPLQLQKPLCSALDAGRRLGVHVTSGFLLNPSKSVTAVIGLSELPQQARIRGCAYCALCADCRLRKRGKNCAV